MNKLTKREYIMQVADAMVAAYGNTLREGRTDIDMAKKVVGRMTKYLHFRQETKASTEKYKTWKRKTDAYDPYCNV